MKKIGTALKETPEIVKREVYHKELLHKLETLKEEVKLGGGKKAIQRHKAKGKLTARERINLLLDDQKEFTELSTFAAYDMYAEYGGAPSAGTVYGIGKVNKKSYVIVANDATVKAGAWFPITVKKNLRAQEIAIENLLPIIYLVDSAGVFLPLQDGIFPDKEHFGRIFRNNAQMSSKGIPQIAAIMGPCVAGGAYLPIMSDEALIVEGEGSVFLAGSHLVKAAIGEEIDNESLGGLGGAQHDRSPVASAHGPAHLPNGELDVGEGEDRQGHVAVTGAQDLFHQVVVIGLNALKLVVRLGVRNEHGDSTSCARPTGRRHYRKFGARTY